MAILCTKEPIFIITEHLLCTEHSADTGEIKRGTIYK